MRWPSKAFAWKKRFAIIPICVDGSYYWWEWYWRRFCGDCYGVSFTDPALTNTDKGVAT